MIKKFFNPDILILMNKKYVMGISIAIIVILVGAFVVLKLDKHSQTVSQMSSVHHRAPLPKEITVTLSKTGFSPSIVTIKVGSAVRWVNKSGTQETVNSDNYPTNQLHRELNFGIFNNNSSVVHTFTKAGTYGYHNQLNHTQEGKIIVEN